ncbi:MAG: amino acid ABC transporter permease [Solirubrobacterales bacterium]
MVEGTKMTLKLTATSVGIGAMIGMFMGMFRLSKNFLLRSFSSGYVHFFRGTPLLVQIYLWYFGILPLLFRPVDPFFGAIVALSVNCGAYTAEIVRAGIQSIDRGQTEAAMSLGLTYRQTMQYVILPQAFKMMIPPLINEFIAILKDTSLVSVIALVELTRQGQLLIAKTYVTFPMWAEVALFYLGLYTIFYALEVYAERRLKTA